MISIKESDLPDTHVVTVRMHHRIAHEPYYDFPLPPDASQSVWETMGWMNPSSAGSETTRFRTPSANAESDTDMEQTNHNTEDLTVEDVQDRKSVV